MKNANRVLSLFLAFITVELLQYSNVLMQYEIPRVSKLMNKMVIKSVFILNLPALQCSKNL